MATSWKPVSADEVERRRQAFMKIAETKSVHSKTVSEHSPAVPAKQEDERPSPVQKEGNSGTFSVHLTAKDFSDKKNSPFTKNNPYNYKISISHPAIYPHYQAYKKFVGETMILSDKQRSDFERYVLAELQRLKITPEHFTGAKQETKQSTPKRWGGYSK